MYGVGKAWTMLRGSCREAGLPPILRLLYAGSIEDWLSMSRTLSPNWPFKSIIPQFHVPDSCDDRDPPISMGRHCFSNLSYVLFSDSNLLFPLFISK